MHAGYTSNNGGVCTACVAGKYKDTVGSADWWRTSNDVLDTDLHIVAIDGSVTGGEMWAEVYTAKSRTSLSCQMGREDKGATTLRVEEGALRTGIKEHENTPAPVTSSRAPRTRSLRRLMASEMLCRHRVVLLLHDPGNNPCGSGSVPKSLFPITGMRCR